MSNIANMKEFINELNSGEIDIENDEDYLDNYTRLFLDDNSKNVYYGFVFNYFGDTVVINLDTGEVYKTPKDASRATGIHNDSISRVCKGKSKTAGGYRWRYLNE